MRYTYIILTMMILASLAFAQEEKKFYVVTVNYTEVGFTVTDVALQQIDSIPAPYPRGDYKIQLRRADGSSVSTQSFALPPRGYIHEFINESGEWEGGLSELPSVFLDFYLPYDEKAKDITILNDKGDTVNIIDVTPFSTLTYEEKATIKLSKRQAAQEGRLREVLIPLGLLVLTLFVGVYWWKKQK